MDDVLLNSGSYSHSSQIMPFVGTFLICLEIKSACEASYHCLKTQTFWFAGNTKSCLAHLALFISPSVCSFYKDVKRRVWTHFLQSLSWFSYNYSVGMPHAVVKQIMLPFQVQHLLSIFALLAPFLPCDTQSRSSSKPAHPPASSFLSPTGFLFSLTHWLPLSHSLWFSSCTFHFGI